MKGMAERSALNRSGDREVGLRLRERSRRLRLRLAVARDPLNPCGDMPDEAGAFLAQQMATTPKRLPIVKMGRRGPWSTRKMGTRNREPP